MPFLKQNIQYSPLFRAALHLVFTLECHGFEAWLVGGCVRDTILGRQIRDFDIATSASWEDVERICKTQHFPTYKTGIQYGTITVGVPYAIAKQSFLQENNAESMSASPKTLYSSSIFDNTAQQSSNLGSTDELFTFEVTTYRCEKDYADGRHPQLVTFSTTIEQDLARRDFTMNALAWHPQRGLLDPYEGFDDINRGVIRAVGDANERFSEDALRICRACRFESQLGFRMETATYAAAVTQKNTLVLLPRERVLKELELFVCGEHICQALMDCIDILEPLLPEVAALKNYPQNTKFHCYDVLEHTAHALGYATSEPPLRWALLFHDVGKPAAHYVGERGIDHFKGHANIGAEMTREICKRLRLPRDLSQKIVLLVDMHDDKLLAEPQEIKHFLVRLNEDVELFRMLCLLKQADSLAHAPGFQKRAQTAKEALDILNDILSKGEPWRICDLAIDGHDLRKIGIEPGPRMGEILASLRDAIIDSKIKNTRKQCLKWVSEIVNGTTHEAAHEASSR